MAPLSKRCHCIARLSDGGFLMIGTSAHYEITAQLGKTGMGEVHRAQDRKLGPDVAIKVLPDEFAKAWIETKSPRLNQFAECYQATYKLNIAQVAEPVKFVHKNNSCSPITEVLNANTES
jgi:serine/threonine protein kinase